MRIANSFDIDRRARAMRGEELSRLLGVAACAIRGAWARLSNRPEPACARRAGCPA